MSLKDYLSPILSRPVKMHFAGWESDTLRLQQNGWRLSADQDICRRSMRLAMRHDQWGLEGITELAEEWLYGDRGMDRSPSVLDHVHLPVGMRAMGYNVMVHEHAPTNFQPINASPQRRGDTIAQFYGDRMTPLAELAHFAPAPLAVTEPIVVPEEDVDALLARILEKQQAAKTSYFRELVRQEGQVLPAHRFHAQIISLPRAA